MALKTRLEDLEGVPLVEAQVLGVENEPPTPKRKTNLTLKKTKSPDSAGEDDEDKQKYAQSSMETAPTTQVKKRQPLFVDPKKMKDKLRENMKKERYCVTNFYWTEGFCQKIARHHIFENFTLGVIATNAVWISIDTDNNKAESLVDAHPVFTIAENLFCIYFTFEWAMRFGAFKNKLNCFRDAWFMFDTFMVAMMIFETWIMFTVQLAMGGGGASTGNAGMLRILRLLRLSRMMRMARLLRSMPELLILIKGMNAAIRSVFFTLLLLVLFIYVFAIYFRQMTSDLDHLRDTYFYSMAKSQHTLLLYGVFLDNLGNLVWDIEAEKDAYHLLLALYLFILLGTLTVMNMLIGVVCEVVSSTAAVEQESITILYMKDSLKDIVIEFENSQEQQVSRMSEGKPTEFQLQEMEYQVSKEKFLALFKTRKVTQLLKEVDVDVFALVDLVDTIFATEDGKEKTLCFGDLVEVMLDQRTTNKATVKDLTDMRKYVKVRMDDMQEKCDELRNSKEHSMIKLESQLTILGRMVEKVTHKTEGTFAQKVKEETARAFAEEQAAERRRHEEWEREEEERKRKGQELLEEQARAEEEARKKEEESKKKHKNKFGFAPFKKETE